MHDPQQPLFASDRERRLWYLSFAAIAAVYATLGLSSTLAAQLNNQNVAAVVFLLCMSLIGVGILTQGLRIRPGGRQIGVTLGIVAVYVFLFFRTTMPERSHLIEYSVVAALLFEALTERAAHARRVPTPALLAIAATTTIGAIDEAVQLFLPNRVFDPADIVFNASAAVFAVLSLWLLRLAKNRRMRTDQA